MNINLNFNRFPLPTLDRPGSFRPVHGGGCHEADGAYPTGGGCHGRRPFYMEEDGGCGHHRMPRLRCGFDRPALSANQGSYLDQLAGKDAKLKQATERLQSMGFTKSPLQSIGGGLGRPAGQPADSTTWLRGNNGKTEIVYLSSDGTVTPAAA